MLGSIAYTTSRWSVYKSLVHTPFNNGYSSIVMTPTGNHPCEAIAFHRCLRLAVDRRPTRPPRRQPIRTPTHEDTIALDVLETADASPRSWPLSAEGFRSFRRHGLVCKTPMAQSARPSQQLRTVAAVTGRYQPGYGDCRRGGRRPARCLGAAREAARPLTEAWCRIFIECVESPVIRGWQ